jgi:transcriptional regulator with XRE-family HTH domain
MAIKSILFKIWKESEIRLGQDLTVSEVAEACGLERKTIASLLENDTSRFYKHVLDKLCEYFECEDGPVPFVIYEHEDDAEGNQEGT